MYIYNQFTTSPTATPIGFRYYHLQRYILLPLLASGITTFSVTYYYPNWLQVLPPSALHTTTPIGFRYYHLQPYILLPPFASGITTFSPTTRKKTCFSQCFILVGFSRRSIVGQCISLAEQVKAILFVTELNSLK